MTLLSNLRTAAFAATLALGALGATATLSVAHAEKPPVFVDLLQTYAAGGYDVVSFFSGTPSPGVDQFTATYQGANYRFASAANRDKFKANPASYAPQYGGYCAWAVSQGKTAPGRPQFWRVVNNKLYFNFSADIQRRWERDIPGLIQAGDRNWPTVLKK